MVVALVRVALVPFELAVIIALVRAAQLLIALALLFVLLAVVSLVMRPKVLPLQMPRHRLPPPVPEDRCGGPP